MKNILNFQISVFGNFNDLEADLEKMNKIGEAFDKNYLPTSISHRNINIETATVDYQQRLSIVNAKSKINIVCNPERLDFNYNVENGMMRMSDPQIVSLLKLGVNDVNIFMDKFELNGYRLALNIYFLSEKINEEKINDYIKKNQGLLKYYNDKFIQEFLFRYSSTNDIEISNVTERINELIEISLALNSQTNERRISLHLDLNTSQLNNIDRFNSNNISDFYDYCENQVFNLHDDFIESLNI